MRKVGLSTKCDVRCLLLASAIMSSSTDVLDSKCDRYCLCTSNRSLLDACCAPSMEIPNECQLQVLSEDGLVLDEERCHVM